MEVTHKAACMVNHRHEKLLSCVKRKHGRTSRSPVCVTAAVERLIHIFVCFIAGLVPLVSAERWHIVITFHPQKPVAIMGEKWLMGTQPELSFLLWRLTHGSISDCVVMQFLFGLVAQPVRLSWHSWCFHEAFMCIQSPCLLFQIN